MSLCVKTPRLPEGMASAHEQIGQRHRRCAPPANWTEPVEGRGQLPSEQDHQGVASEPPGGASEASSLAIACGGVSLQRFAAGLARCRHGPAWRVPRPSVVRRHRASCRQDRCGARGPGAIRHVAPTDGHQVCSAPVPVSRARDGCEVARGAPLPRHRAVGACGCGRHARAGSGAWLALHARAAQRGARGRRFVHRGLTITRAPRREGLAVLRATPRGGAGTLAAVADEEAGSRGNPAPEARQPPPGQVRRRRLTCALPSLPLGGGGTNAPKLGRAQGRVANGSFTSPDPTPPVCPQREASELGGERPPSRGRPWPHTWGPGGSVTVSSPARSTGPDGTTGASRHVIKARASAQVDHRRWETTR